MYMYVFMLFYFEILLFIDLNGYIDGYTDLHLRDYIYIFVYMCISVHSIISMLLKYCIISSSWPGIHVPLCVSMFWDGLNGLISLFCVVEESPTRTGRTFTCKWQMFLPFTSFTSEDQLIEQAPFHLAPCKWKVMFIDFYSNKLDWSSNDLAMNPLQNWLKGKCSGPPPIW